MNGNKQFTANVVDSGRCFFKFWPAIDIDLKTSSSIGSLFVYGMMFGLQRFQIFHCKFIKM